MLTYSLQWLIAVFTMGFAAAALRVARGPAPLDAAYRYGWRLAGAAFAVHAASQAVQYAWGGAAMWGGRAGVMEAYLRWAPAMNHSRTFLILAFVGALVLSAFRPVPEGGRLSWGYLGCLAAAFAAGGLVGHAEGSLIGGRHYLRVAGWDTVILVVMLAALFASLLRDRLDRFLWSALTTYASSVAISVIWFAALTQIDDPNVWSPAPWQIALYRAVFSLVMLLLAVRCLALARRGLPIRGLLGSRDDRPAYGAVPSATLHG